MPSPSSEPDAEATGRRRVAGLDEPLPEGEEVLWEGGPDRTALARHLLHGRKIFVYFALLAAWSLLTGLREGAAAGTIAVDASLYLLAGGAVVGVCHAIAEVIRRHTAYLLTDERLLLNVGFAFPKVINLPLDQIESASIRTRRDGSGILTVRPAEKLGLGYFLLWPHARPWHLRQPEPALRGLAEPRRVGELLADALEATRSAREEADGDEPTSGASDGPEDRTSVSSGSRPDVGPRAAGGAST